MTIRGLPVVLALLMGSTAPTDGEKEYVFERGRVGAGPASGPATRMTNEFAIDLYRLLGDEETNLVFSPYSVSSALVMAMEGARGATAAEMGEALRFPFDLRTSNPARPWDLDPVHEGLAALNASLRGRSGEEGAIREEIDRLRAVLEEKKRIVRTAPFTDDWEAERRAAHEARQIADRLNELFPRVDRYEIRVANALWVNERFPLHFGFETTLRRHHGTGAALPLDFRQNAAARINEWVAEQTKERIRDLVDPASLDSLTALVLTNAVYFRGSWVEPFHDGATKESDFHLADGGIAQAPLMFGEPSRAGYGAFHADGSLFETPHRLPEDSDEASRVRCYPGDDGFAIIELPYKGDRLSMVVVAPNRADGLPTIERLLSGERLSRWLGQLERRRVTMRLPRFRLETGTSLMGALRDLGMDAAFDEGRADFSGMTAGNDTLFISEVVHKAFVDVNEEGTEAAAATAVITASITIAVRTRPFIPSFRADRPFLFLIRDRASGVILFLGRMICPEETTT